MKQKLLVFILSIIMILGMLPVTALAYEHDGLTYDDNDFNKLQAFLNQPSEIPGQTNGQRINITSYNPDDPTTWMGVVWNNDSPKRVITINTSGSWRGLDLAGSLDVSEFSALTDLFCDSCGLTSLDASDNPALTQLDCSYNTLTSLDVSGSTALSALYCHTSQLASLSISENTALTFLECGNNRLTSLDVRNNKALNYLNCQYNQLTSLDVSENTALTYLNCENNQLASLDVTACSLLEGLECSYNDLTELDVGMNPTLFELYCSSNDLAALDVSANPVLTSLYCSNNRLTSLDASANTALLFLNCTDNRLTLIKANINGSNIEIISNGNGTVGLYIDEGGYARATPNGSTTFVGWMESGLGGEGSTETEYPIAPGSGDYLLAALFSPCTVTFDKNGGDTEASPTIMNVALGEIIEMPPEPPTHADYTFGGWYRDTECTLPWNLASDIVMANMMLYAKWTQDSSAGGGSDVTYYTVTFDLNGGTHTGGGRLVQRVRYGSAAIAPMAAKDGYVFSGWDKEFSAVKGNLIVKAQWTEAQSGSIGIPKTGGVSLLPIILLAGFISVIVLLKHKAKKA